MFHIIEGSCNGDGTALSSHAATTKRSLHWSVEYFLCWQVVMIVIMMMLNYHDDDYHDHDDDYHDHDDYHDDHDDDYPDYNHKLWRHDPCSRGVCPRLSKLQPATFLRQFFHPGLVSDGGHHDDDGGDNGHHDGGGGDVFLMQFFHPSLVNVLKVYLGRCWFCFGPFYF